MMSSVDKLQEIILTAAEQAKKETINEPAPETPKKQKWPISCTVGPGLEGAIACESKVGYVNGAKGWLVYRGYNIFDLCAYSTYEETCYLLLHGAMPKQSQLDKFKERIFDYTRVNNVVRKLLGFPIEEMSVMGALRLGTNLMRSRYSDYDMEKSRPGVFDAVGADEDSFAMETAPLGSNHATYEFKPKKRRKKSKILKKHEYDKFVGEEAAISLIGGISAIIAAVSRVHRGKLPLEPLSGLSHAANLIYMITGREPSPLEERVMDIALILHADHGMNASTFATLVVGSTLADIYYSVGSGVAALSGPLHGGANEQVIKNLREIGSPQNVESWVSQKMAQKSKIAGFGHRVYKAYDPRARILGPLAKLLASDKPEAEKLFATAVELERTVLEKFGEEKKIFPNVDFYSGLVYTALGFDDELFTPMFAASRVAGWTSRVLEYMNHNRIFRPRGLYIGEFDKTYKPMEQR